MVIDPKNTIILYKTDWCGQSLLVQDYLISNGFSVELIDIDQNGAARDDLIRLNKGYASVPTLLFADGTKLTEPSIAEVQKKLQSKPDESLFGRIRKIFSR